jgi:predicted enzyme related to lactoylglutathione lyase
MARVIYFELPVENMDRAISFYEYVFGWKITRHDRVQGPYYAVSTGDALSPGINGSFYEKQEDWNMVTNIIEVDDIDKVIDLIEHQGGEIFFPKTTIKGVGYLAYFRDPEGNAFGIMQDEPSVDSGL